MTSKKNHRIRIEEFWKKVFRPKFRLLGSEVAVFADFGINPESQRIGSIDYLAKVGNRTFLIEEDLSIGNKWHWCKVLAYKAAFHLDNPSLKSYELVPCVFLNDEYFDYEMRNVLSLLKVEYFFFRFSFGYLEITNSSRPELLRYTRIVF